MVTAGASLWHEEQELLVPMATGDMSAGVSPLFNPRRYVKSSHVAGMELQPS